MTREKLNEEVKLSQTTIVKADEAVLGLSRMVRNARGQILFPKDASYRTSYDKGVKLFQEASAALE
ncbi:MAG: chemotaxis protein, partial [Xenococcaceae cyanobacterium]